MAFLASSPAALSTAARQESKVERKQNVAGVTAA